MVGRRVDHCNGAGLLIVATAEIHALGRAVVPHVVGAALKIDGRDRIVGLAVVNVNLAPAAGPNTLFESGAKATPCGSGRFAMVCSSTRPPMLMASTALLPSAETKSTPRPKAK